jgi:hypothetical protein
MNRKKFNKTCIIFLLFTAMYTIVNAEQPATVVVYIIRHGEKPPNGDNLSCQGQNRALALQNVLYAKLKVPDHTFIPSVGSGKSTAHSRMFQTVSPFAIKYNLVLNSKYGEKDVQGVAKDILKKNGTVLMVWEHSAIPGVAAALGVKGTLKWPDDDFDSIWIITVSGSGASLSIAKEGLRPSASCNN